MPLTTLFLFILGGVVAIGLLVAVPLVAIWTEHQRKMASIIHGQAGPTRSEEFQRLKADFEMLRESVTSHALSVDDNLKALAGRVNALEGRLVTGAAEQQILGGHG